MRNTSYSREVTRHVKRERPAPGPACDLTNAQEASPILSKSCVSRWLHSTLEEASCCHPVRNPCSKSAGFESGGLSASNQSVPRGRFKTHFADQVPGWAASARHGCLCSAIQLVQELVRDLRVANTDHWEAISPTGPRSGLPHAHNTTQTKTSQRRSVATSRTASVHWSKF